MSDRPFAHLHCHTHYSLLDGATRIPDLVKKVKANGMNSVAITDHGNLYGAMEFYNTCRAEEVNPVIGMEAYIAPLSRFDRSASRMKEASYHLTLLAMNPTGFQNLIRLSSKSFLEGFYYKPRIDKEILEQFSEGLICLSGCASSELSRLILAEKWKESEELIGWYQKVFGDRFYMEIQNSGVDIQVECGEGTIDLAQRMGLPLVATNDAHYLDQSDSGPHDVLLCINTGSLRSDEKRMRMSTTEFHVRTPDEMYAAFPDQYEAVKRSQEIADRVDIQLEQKKHYPVFYPPDNKTDIQYLKEICEQQLVERFEDELTDAHWKRLKYELSVIEKMGYASYFLIVWDFVRFAEENGIPCTARGSACGALVAFVLGLSTVCPLKYDLLFERFLDPSRKEPPDIDIDFCRDRRQMVIDYTKQKYGEDCVSQIGTYGTLKAKMAIRDVGRALGVPLSRVNEIAGMIPETLNIKLATALEESPELKSAYDQDPQVKELIDIGMRLEGLARSAGTHAAGVVVADNPLYELLPLQKITGKEDIITQWDGPTVESVGLLKMDFLGLRNLTILDKAVQNVKKHQGIAIIPHKLPLDDQETFALLQRGETKGIFQLESGGMRDLLTKMKPDSFFDIIATSALYRPGPLEGGMVMTYVNVKHGREPIPEVHPIIDEILVETYGVMVYQEQVMRILNRLGGIELPSSYQCIKAISKKKLKIIAMYKEQFLKGSVEQGLSEDKAKNIFEMIEKFAGYGFNKSHSTAYGAIAYQTAYLKAHYPVEFMAALLSCGMESSDRIMEHVDDARRMKIEVQPPDVNRSDVDFTVDGEKIIFGMGAIKGVGESTVQAIVNERQANGPYQHIFDLTERIDPKLLNKSSLELLIKAGALDHLGGNREQLTLVVERAVQASIARQKDKQMGQKSLFGDDAPAMDGEADQTVMILPDAPDWTHTQKLAGEKEVFGFYLTSHPLTERQAEITRYASHTVHAVGELEDGDEVTLGGMVSSIKRATTKKPSRNGHTKYVNFDFEDPTGIVRCIMWPEEFSRMGEKVEPEAIVYVKGKVDRRGREPNIVVNRLMTVEEADKEYTTQVAIKFQNGMHTRQDMVRVRDILDRYPGNTEVVLLLDSQNEEEERLRYVISTPAALRVTCSTKFRDELTAAIGQANFRMHAPAVKPRRPSASIGR
ncbi:MAG: DNA polymerase III subunit alpha [Planctomycetaceae bacterium]